MAYSKEEKKKYAENKISMLQEKLENGLRDFLNPESFKYQEYSKYLSYISQFRTYSLKNIFLIQAAYNGEASFILGEKKWEAQNNPVNTNAKGAEIFIPVIKKIKKNEIEIRNAEKNEEKVEEKIKILKYITGKVYDVSETLNPDFIKEKRKNFLSELKNSNELLEEIYQNLTEIVSKESKVREVDLLVNGSYSPFTNEIEIRKSMKVEQKIKTLIHEFSHCIHEDKISQYKMKKRDTKEKEVIVEAVAYIICNELNIDSSSYSFGYIIHWLKGKNIDDNNIDIFLELMEEIREIANEILDKTEELRSELNEKLEKNILEDKENHIELEKENLIKEGKSEKTEENNIITKELSILLNCFEKTSSVKVLNKLLTKIYKKYEINNDVEKIIMEKLKKEDIDLFEEILNENNKDEFLEKLINEENVVIEEIYENKEIVRCTYSLKDDISVEVKVDKLLSTGEYFQLFKENHSIDKIEELLNNRIENTDKLVTFEKLNNILIGDVVEYDEIRNDIIRSKEEKIVYELGFKTIDRKNIIKSEQYEEGVAKERYLYIPPNLKQVTFDKVRIYSSLKEIIGYKSITMVNVHNSIKTILTEELGLIYTREETKDIFNIDFSIPRDEKQKINYYKTIDIQEKFICEIQEWHNSIKELYNEVSKDWDGAENLYENMNEFISEFISDVRETYWINNDISDNGIINYLINSTGEKRDELIDIAEQLELNNENFLELINCEPEELEKKLEQINEKLDNEEEILINEKFFAEEKYKEYDNYEKKEIK